MRARRDVVRVLVSVLALIAGALVVPCAALACPACATGGLGDDPRTVRLVAAFLALPFVLATLLALSARARRAR